MDASKFTTRSVDAINAAQLLATTAGNAQTEPVHLLVALLRQEQGIAPTLLDKAGADAGAVARAAEHALASLPKASGATVQTAAASGATGRGRSAPSGYRVSDQISINVSSGPNGRNRYDDALLYIGNTK